MFSKVTSTAAYSVMSLTLINYRVPKWMQSFHKLLLPSQFVTMPCCLVTEGKC